MMLEAFEQALALGLHRPLDHLRVGQREIGRRHRVDERLGGEAQLLAGLPRRPPRSRRPSRAAGRRSANRSGGSCRRAGCRAIPGRRSACPCRLSPRARSRSLRPPSARCQIDSPSVHRSACICMILAGSPNIVIPGQAAAAFSGSGARAAAAPICWRDAPSSAAGRGPSPRSNAACPRGSASGTAARPARRRPWCRGRP